MKLVICTKFQVNQMNCVESRRGGGPIDPPPSRLRVTIFSRQLLGLILHEMMYITMRAEVFHLREWFKRYLKIVKQHCRKFFLSFKRIMIALKISLQAGKFAQKLGKDRAAGERSHRSTARVVNGLMK